MTTTFRTSVATAALVGTTMLSSLAAHAQDKDISWIYCGDKIDPIHEQAIKTWEEQNAGWKIAVDVVGWAQCQDKATTLAAAGSPPSIAYVGSRALKEFAENDMIVPVPMSDAEKASYYPHIVDTVTFDGDQWGVPIAFSTKALYWNKDLFKAAGLDPEKPPTTWAEEIEYARIIKEKTGIPGFGLSAKSFDNTMHQFLHWVFTNNGEVVDQDGNVVLDSKPNLEALTAYRDIAKYAEEGPTAYEQMEVRAIFLDGKVAMIQSSSGAATRLEEKTTDRFDWGVTTIPIGPEAKGPGTLLITDSLAVFKDTGVEDKAIEFAKYITSPEVQVKYELQGGAGLTPLRPSAEVDAWVEQYPFWKPFIDGIAFGGPEPLFTDYHGLQNTMVAMIQSVITGQAEPEAALKKADAELKALDNR